MGQKWVEQQTHKDEHGRRKLKAIIFKHAASVFTNYAEKLKREEEKEAIRFGEMAHNEDDQLRRFEFFDFIVVLAKKACKLLRDNPNQVLIKSSLKDRSVPGMLEFIIKKHILFQNQYRMRSQLFR